jgi:prefoldin subunit 5
MNKELEQLDEQIQYCVNTIKKLKNYGFKNIEPAILSYETLIKTLNELREIYLDEGQE